MLGGEGCVGGNNRVDDGGVADGVGLGVGGGGGGSDVASFHALEDGYGGMRLGGFGVVLGVLGLVLGGEDAWAWRRVL